MEGQTLKAITLPCGEYSISEKGQITNYVLPRAEPRTVLSYVPNEPNVDIEPAFELSSITRRMCFTQILLRELTLNYVHTAQDPEHSLLLAHLPAYQSSLETRYPPICPSCLPAVEEEIKRRDNMARTSALGGFLKESRGKGKQRQVAVTQGQKEALERQLVIWRVRGVLWVVTLAAYLSVYGAGE